MIGRDREVRALAEHIDAARAHEGGALLIRGAAGIGKSSILEAASAHAAARRFQILSTAGVNSESHLPFAALHQILRPVLRGLDRLPEAYGNAIRTAFGLSDVTVPSPFLIALGVLTLLCGCAEAAPTLVLVDDAQWLDGATADVLGFVARRLASDPILLVLALRDGFESPLLDARIPELRIEGLSDADAASLLEVRATGLAPALCSRVLRDAAGNPLALVELPVALAAAHSGPVRSTAPLPLTDRLERAFADRLPSLTAGARGLLHVAATEENGVLPELLRAASKLEGHEVMLEAAAEAGDAGLVMIDGDTLRFRHPLMRPAIRRSMTLRERQAAHAALADALDGDPDRRAWHRAAAATGSNEPIAADLEAAAARAEHHGATLVAMKALERAAQLAEDPARRGRRLVHAAYLALVLGWRSDLLRLLQEIDDVELDPLDRPVAAWLREAFARGSWSGASRIATFVEIADRMRVDGDIDRGLQALTHIAHRCWWSNPDEETRASMISAAERFPVPEHDARLIHVLALAGPVERGAVVLDRLSRHRAVFQGDPGDEAHLLGQAAMAVGDFHLADLYLEAETFRCRAHGWLGALAGALALQAWAKIQRGDWKTAGSMASEGTRLAEEAELWMWTTVASLASATIAAYRGEVEIAEKLAAAGEQALLPRGANPLLALVQYPRGAAALAAGRHDEAYQHLRRIFDPADNAYHPHVRSWALVDLVEAAVHSGQEDEASAFVSELEPIAERTRSPLLEATLEFARAVLSPDDSEAAFRNGACARLAIWPFAHARLRLAYGLWLRRQRRPADARTPLRAARDAFDALGAVPWGERARQELRATGETSRRRTRDLSDALSPQELQIARLAAAGLSNKEIGRQLFLSHRTIGSHLYRIFPKLGVTARSHLRAALQGESSQPSG